MLGEPDRTRYDLHFGLFGFPIRVHPWFWLATALFGSSALSDRGVDFFLAWIGVVFLSILVHELGHGFAFRLFGVRSHLVLHAFGGLAIPHSRVPRRWQRIAVSLAGPAAGFALFGLLYASNQLTSWSQRNPLTLWLYFQLVFVNVAWGLMNLLPVWPLDGGQVCEEVCVGLSPWKGRGWSLRVSILVAAAACVYSLACAVGVRENADWILMLPPWLPLGSLWTALLFGALAAQSYQLLEAERWQGQRWER